MSNVFRTIEISRPLSSEEPLQIVTVKSRALGMRAELMVFAPVEAESLKNMPLVILLHGVYGSHWGWSLQGNAHRTLQRLVAHRDIPAMALAMPSDGLWGDGSGYLRHPDRDYERWIVDEVPLAAGAALGCISENSPRFISGLSMGGFGALRLAAKFTGRFRAVSAHSSITHFDQLRMFVEEDLDRYQASPEDRSVFETMLRRPAELPWIRFDCGTSDPLIEHNRELHRQLKRAGIPHLYEEFPGGHEWSYWEQHLEETLRFFGRIAKDDAQSAKTV